MVNKNLIYGVVVLYNPNFSEVKKNISSYIKYLDRLYCIDNSDVNNSIFFSGSKFRYVFNQNDGGLAKALAYGCSLAIEDGAEILVTLDQDTMFQEKSLEKLISVVCGNKEVVATPNIKRIVRCNGERKFKNEAMYPLKNEKVSWAITSGTVFSASLYNDIGGFDRKLFIGQIDQDFCTAVYRSGYSILRIGTAFIYQELGNATEHHFLWKKVYAPNLLPNRYYYVFRNERYLRKKWGKYYKKNKVELYKYIVVVILYERHKYRKLQLMLQGFRDGRKMIKGDQL